MKIQIRHFPIYISMDIMIPILFFAVLRKGEIFLTALLFSFLHELSHLFTARLLKYAPEKISVNMFGEVLHLKDVYILPEHEILIHISGPMFNLITALILLILHWEGILTGWENAMLINGVLGLFNLLPFYPLDGGKIIYVYLKYFMDEDLARKLIFSFAKVFLIFNFFLGIYLLQYNLLNCLICLLAVNIFISVLKDSRGWDTKRLRSKIERERSKYV